MVRVIAILAASVLVAVPATAQPIIRLEARSTDGGILLLWEAAPEGEHLGFHVLRQARGDTSYARITERLLSEGPVFEYLDRAAKPVLAYIYEIQALDPSGRGELVGGVSAVRSLAPHLTLSATQASPGGEAVRISWASDLDHLEFYVHRAAGDASTRLHAAPHPRGRSARVRGRRGRARHDARVPARGWRQGRRAVRIHFSLAGATRVRIRIFDASGRFVSAALDDFLSPGDHVTMWEGASARAPSAVYFLRLDAGSLTETRKLVVID